MVVGRERFTPRADAKGVVIVVAIGLATFAAAAVLIVVLLGVMRLAGVGA